MTTPLSAFLDESTNNFSDTDAIVDEVKKGNSLEDGSRNYLACGELYITGCIDWLHAASKNAFGLEIPHHISLSSTVSKVFSSCSASHLFILLSDQKTLLSLGRNSHGQLGVGDTDLGCWPRKVVLECNSDISKVTVGKSHSLILTTSSALYGCGSNSLGQLGLGDGVRTACDFTTPVALSISAVRDIACGQDYSLLCTNNGALYSFGHPEYGQLGLGTNGQYIKDGGKGPAVQYKIVSKPTIVNHFYNKIPQRHTNSEINETIKIIAVAAGKNHSLCLEEWEDGGLGRVFSFGFGGYGRLGHSIADDELFPVEISIFSQQRQVPMKQIRRIGAGASFSLAVAKSGHLYYFGKLPNSPRGEATMYPKIQDELYDWNVQSFAGGHSSVLVAASNKVAVWGVPVAGKFGVIGGGKNCSNPNLIEFTNDLPVVDICCGYGFNCFVVSTSSDTISTNSVHAIERLRDIPELTKEILMDNNQRTGDEDDDEENNGNSKNKKKGSTAADKKTNSKRSAADNKKNVASKKKKNT